MTEKTVARAGVRAARASAIGAWMMAAIAVSLSACAQVHRNEATFTGEFLTRAGFTVLADPAVSQRRLAAMPPLKMVEQQKDGQPVYSWADPYACRCVYVGDEAAYARYRKLIQEHYTDTITSIPLVD